MQGMVSQSPKFSLSLFMYSSDIEHKTEVTRSRQILNLEYAKNEGIVCVCVCVCVVGGRAPRALSRVPDY